MILDNERVKKVVKESELIDEETLNQLSEEAESQNIPLNEHLVKQNAISEDNLARLIAADLGISFIQFKGKSVDKEALNTLPEDFARKQRVLAFEQTPDKIKIATSKPDDAGLISLVKKKAGKEVEVYYTTEGEIDSGLSKYRVGIEKRFNELIEKQAKAAKGKEAEDKPVAEMLGTIIEYAYHNKASDIHFDPYEKKIIIRFRMDGVMHDIISLPKHVLNQLITRIKVLSRLRIDEHRAAQDGKMVQKLPEEKLDIRVSIIPTTHGEKAVMRLLISQAQYLTLDKLGLSKGAMKKVKNAYERPWGMILATGPTGCGKTTTLYSILQILNTRTVNISTIEDPVEYNMPGINQIQVNPKTDLTFAKGLRALLRQDPDILMVGEIRDEETAYIAVNAAMTGHLVLSTLHTNDAATAPVRLGEMDVEPYLVASTVNVVVAQRLVRTICSECRKSYTVSKGEAQKIENTIDVQDLFGKETVEGMRLYRGEGCKVCNNRGYKGRTGVFEVIEISDEIRRLIVTNANSSEIQKQALKEGMTPMIKDGVNKALLGVTTIDEVLRVTKEG